MGDARRASAAKGENLLAIAAKLLADALIAGEPWSDVKGYAHREATAATGA